MRQEIIVALFLQLIQKRLGDLNVLQAEEQIVPAGHLGLDFQHPGLQLQLRAVGPFRRGLRILGVAKAFAQLSLIHPAQSQMVFSGKTDEIFLPGDFQSA